MSKYFSDFETIGIVIFMIMLVIMTRAMFSLPDEIFRFW